MNDNRTHYLSFIICARNEERGKIETTLEGIIHSVGSLDHEIVLIDDCSVNPITCLRKEIRLFRNSEPHGVSLCRRQGAKVANGDILVWLDGHMTFEHDWLKHMLAYVESGSLLCPAAWDYEQTKCHCWGSDLTWCKKRNYHLKLSPGFVMTHRKNFPGHGAFPVPVIIGGCCMMLQKSYLKIGGFSPLMRVWGMEDIDISLRAWMSGVGVQCITDAQVGHLYRTTFPYNVNFAHVEFNQLATIKTIFEDKTSQTLEQFFAPLPNEVSKWLDDDKVQIQNWRRIVQSRKLLNDKELIHHIMPSLSLIL